MEPLIRSSFVLVVLVIQVCGVVSSSIDLSLTDPTIRLKARRLNISCMLVFGDSSVDPGNNNVLNTTFKGNFPPYGIDYIAHRPTGRFSDGLLGTDLIAQAIGLKSEIPAFLQPNLDKNELLSGVSFASAASGYDDLTANLTDVLTIPQQIQYFKNYMAQLRGMVGEERKQDILRNALVVLSAGTNDFIQNYYLDPRRPKQFTVTQYIDFLAYAMVRDIKELHQLGGNKFFAVVGVPPLGCLPAVKTIMGTTECVEALNNISSLFNSKIITTIRSTRNWFGPTKVVYVDIYSTFLDAVNRPNKYGFTVSSKGCCGSGEIEFGETCKELPACKEPSKYVFWDAVHPTQSMYKLIAAQALKSIDKFMS